MATSIASELRFPGTGPSGATAGHPSALMQRLCGGHGGTTTSLEKIRIAATSGDGGDVPSKSITLAYRDILQQIWVIDHAGMAAVAQPARVSPRSSPKHLADQAPAARLLGHRRGRCSPAPRPVLRFQVQNQHGCRNRSRRWSRSVRVYAQSSETRVGQRHYRWATRDRPDRRARGPARVGDRSEVERHRRRQRRTPFAVARGTTRHGRVSRPGDHHDRSACVPVPTVAVVPAALLGP